MVIVHVEHFLNDDGRAFFPTWLQHSANIISQFEGYRSLRQLHDIEKPESCHLLLEFDSFDLLRAWASSPQHDDLINQLAPYRFRKHQSEIYQAGTIIEPPYEY